MKHMASGALTRSSCHGTEQLAQAPGNIPQANWVAGLPPVRLATSKALAISYVVRTQ